jgi:hypothetical protein
MLTTSLKASYGTQSMSSQSAALQGTVVHQPMKPVGVTRVIPCEVGNKMKGVTASVETLQQQTKDLHLDLEEQENIRSRKSCVIVHGLQEPIAGSNEARKQEEYDLLSDLLHQINCDVVSVDPFTRLGKKQEGPEAKPRPVKLTLVSEGQQTRVLMKAKNLKKNKNGFDKVYIHQDLTPKQRLAREKLV